MATTQPTSTYAIAAAGGTPRAKGRMGQQTNHSPIPTLGRQPEHSVVNHMSEEDSEEPAAEGVHSTGRTGDAVATIRRE
jgi:hypothetical protein